VLGISPKKLSDKYTGRTDITTTKTNDSKSPRGSGRTNFSSSSQKEGEREIGDRSFKKTGKARGRRASESIGRRCSPIGKPHKGAEKSSKLRAKKIMGRDGVGGLMES